MSTEKIFADDYELCAEEIAATIGDRNGSHGDPIENHEHIAALWSAYLGVDIEPKEVAACMILLKLSRDKVGGPDRDHWRDSQGYAEIANMIEVAEAASQKGDTSSSEVQSTYEDER